MLPTVVTSQLQTIDVTSYLHLEWNMKRIQVCHVSVKMQKLEIPTLNRLWIKNKTQTGKIRDCIQVWDFGRNKL